MTISIKSPTSTTGSIQKNGSDVLTIDSSDNVTVVNNLSVSGTVSSTGAITFDGGTISGNVNFDSGTLYVDATNNRVGIGTSSPSEKLRVVNTTGVNTTFTNLVDADLKINLTSGVALVSPSTGILALGTSNTERMRINSSGQLIHNGTSTFGYGGTVFFHSGAGGRTMNTYIGSGTLQSLAMWVGGTERGYINSDSGGTTYNTTSDYRLKENVQPILEPINKVKLLKPCTWTWVDDNESNGIGFIAHELAEVVPTAVSGIKDETETYTDEDGVEQTRPKYQGVDQSRIVGLLTAALQEAITKIEDLEARIQALENPS